MKRFRIWLEKAKNRLPHKFIVGSIHRKQLVAFLVIALIPLLGLGVASYSIATHLLMDKATKQLEGIRKLKSSRVQAYFSERRQDLDQLADTLARLYETGESKISAKNRQEVEATQRAFARALKEVVSPRLKDKKIDMIRNYREQSGFENIYLITNRGYVFHSANHGPDRYINLLTGPFKHTNLARLVARVRRTKSFGMSDFENYMPAQHEPAAFMAQPVISSGQAKFIVAAQFSISQINAVAEDRTGLGRTGETYFVGPDKMLRNNPHRLKAPKIMSWILSPEHTIDTEATLSAFNGTSGTKVIKNHTGVTTLSSWQPLTIADPNPVNPNGIRWALVTEIEADEIREPIQTFTNALAGAIGVEILLVIGGAFLLSGGLARQIRHIVEVLNNIGVGDFTARCQVVSRDDLGLLAESLNAMLDNTLDFIQSSDERHKLQSSIMKLLTDISALTEGDLTIRAEVTEDMTGAIADSFNSMAEQLSLLVSNVKKSTLEVSSTSRTVSDSTIKLARTNDEHAKRINGMVKAIEQMSLSIQMVSEHASQSAEVSEQAKHNALSGADAVRQTNKAMNAIRERVQEAARAIKRLGESSQEIGNIVQIINDIADRTSILALNASIQAAAAGDAGRGFAVVAEEVQRLAEQSAKSTKQIDTLVKTIQGEINEAGTRMDDSIERVVHGTQLADGAHGKLEDIEAVSTQLAELVQAISMAAKEQAISSENISTTMKKLGQVSKQASLQGRHTALSITNLAKTSEQLHQSVEVFTLAQEILEEDEDLEVLEEVA
ncbi:MAG: methyl-accepting chemotaxis protein [Desulfobacteraceae bacterium]|jgi:methyl-accepting chemotaxis protein